MFRAELIGEDFPEDSLSMMDFVMDLEDQYDIDIPMNIYAEWKTMQDVINYLENRLGE